VAPPGGLYLTKVDYGSKPEQPVDELAEDEA